MAMKKALVLGASGLVGTHLVQELIKSSEYGEIHLAVRKSLNLDKPLVYEHIIDFDNMQNDASLFEVDEVFCCLGTTIKKAGTKKAFYVVDFDYPVFAGQMAESKSVKSFHVISAIGADKKSPFFYSRTKGELEEALSSLQLQSLHIYRPSLLLGNRSEFRFGEATAGKLSKVFAPVMMGPLAKYKPIEASDVAKAMVRNASAEKYGNGVFWHHSEDMHP